MAQTFNGNITVDGTIEADNVTADGKLLTRNTTVTVGLETSGYTSAQVDILIKPTDSVTAKLTEAINSLPTEGGEIKLLEGLYDIPAEDPLAIRKDNVKISGVGYATKISSEYYYMEVYSKNTVLENMYLERRSQYTFADVYGDGDLTVIGCKITNTSTIYATVGIDGNTSKIYIWSSDIGGKGINRNIDNWRNAYVDGMATYVLINSAVTLGTGFTDVAASVPVTVGDSLEFAIFIMDTGDFSYNSVYWSSTYCNVSTYGGNHVTVFFGNNAIRAKSTSGGDTTLNYAVISRYLNNKEY